MAKPDLGKKLTCPSCGAKFYDLNKTPPKCPKCEHVIEPKAEADEAEVELDDDDDALLDDDGDEDLSLDDDDDDDVIEDTSDLGDEDDDVSEVKEHIEIDDDAKD